VPRLPVDGKKVIEHRITFGTKEREMIDSAITGYEFNRIATPIVAGLSDVSFMLTVTAILGYFFPKIVMPDANSPIEQVLQNLQTGIKESLADRLERKQEFDEAQNQAVFDAGSSILAILQNLL
tara:strand:+ start:856 stop:1227 length:372 start_codon:yes stop_codon:yes gene_type:complete